VSTNNLNSDRRPMGAVKLAKMMADTFHGSTDAMDFLPQSEKECWVYLAREVLIWSYGGLLDGCIIEWHDTGDGNVEERVDDLGEER